MTAVLKYRRSAYRNEPLPSDEAKNRDREEPRALAYNTPHAYIMVGLVYGGKGTSVDKVDICTQFDSDDLSWVKDKVRYTRVEDQIMKALRKKSPKPMIRYCFQMKSRASPRDKVELVLKTPVCTAIDYDMGAHVFDCEIGIKKVELCINFGSESLYEQFKKIDFDNDHIYMDVREAVQKKYGREMDGRIDFKRKAGKEDKVDLIINYAPRSI